MKFIVGMSLILVLSGLAAAQNVAGAWRLDEVRMAGADAKASKFSNPNIYLFTKGHWSTIRIEGDRFKVLVERERAGNGAERLGRILAADVTLSGEQLQAVRFGDGKNSFYDQKGRSLRAAFLRAPLEFRRISSRFGMRRHPILGVLKAHKGTDYAASSGTPVRAIGDGVVIRANYNRGYGNVLEIRHRNGYVSRYGHLRGFARGVRPGTRVSIAQTVAYVGSTGLSTAPHLHFEVLVGGVQRDPRVALASKVGFPLAAGERRAFDSLRTRLFATLDSRLTSTRVADASGASGSAGATGSAGVSPDGSGM